MNWADYPLLARYTRFSAGDCTHQEVFTGNCHYCFRKVWVCRWLQHSAIAVITSKQKQNCASKMDWHNSRLRHCDGPFNLQRWLWSWLWLTTIVTHNYVVALFECISSWLTWPWPPCLRDTSKEGSPLLSISSQLSCANPCDCDWWWGQSPWRKQHWFRIWTQEENKVIIILVGLDLGLLC